jgi:hypothetical protein
MVLLVKNTLKYIFVLKLVCLSIYILVTDFCYLQSAICTLYGVWTLLYTKLSVVGSLSYVVFIFWIIIITTVWKVVSSLRCLWSPFVLRLKVTDVKIKPKYTTLGRTDAVTGLLIPLSCLGFPLHEVRIALVMFPVYVTGQLYIHILPAQNRYCVICSKPSEIRASRAEPSFRHWLGRDSTDTNVIPL